MTEQKLKSILEKARIEYGDYEDTVESKLQKISPSEKLVVASGASKTCLIFAKENFVIKWNSTRYGTECQNEYRIYQKAIEARVSQVFPKTNFFAKINDIEFYIQEYIPTTVQRQSQLTEERADKIVRTVKPATQKRMAKGFNIPNVGYNRHLDERWAKVVISIYGKTFVKALCAFIQENKINDLHTSNIGYKGKHPYIIDFSGYENNF